MTGNRGGRRDGAGRKPGSKNKKTIAKEVVADVVDVDDAERLEQAIHERGHKLLQEMERIVLDRVQPVAARIMAAKVALPFLMPKQSEPEMVGGMTHAALAERITRGRKMAEQLSRGAQQRLEGTRAPQER